MEKKVLIVDDEEPIRNAFTKAFVRNGWDVQTAESGEEALQLMQENPRMICFLDLNLPGMTGVELCRKIRAKWPMAICHAVTGYSSLFELSECREAGFEDYFVKPVDIPILLGAAAQAQAKIDRWKDGAARSREIFIPL
jgi:DNA-binding response OmpR family regulator